VIEQTAAYKRAITGDTRKILLKAVVYIVDPDITFGEANSSGAILWCNLEQLHDKEMTIDYFTTLEHNRWILDETSEFLPDDPDDASGQIGFVSDAVCDNDGVFDPPVFVEEAFNNVSILQACSVYFPTEDYDGVPSDFTVDIKSGGKVYFSKSFTGNMENKIVIEGFTVNSPDAICVTIEKWNMPGRRARIAEIIPGLYEEWDEGTMSQFNVVQQGDVSCLKIPYGTCTINTDNTEGRYDPLNKNSVFQSIEERQGIDISIGVETDDGNEWKHVGVYYVKENGWSTADSGMTMQWSTVDILGMLQNLVYSAPETLPTTLNEWLKSIVRQLGTTFENRCCTDQDYGDLPVSVESADDVNGQACGDILLWLCQATGTWPRADAETGYLAAEPLWNQGNKLDLDNMTARPTMKANDSVSSVVFTFPDDTQYAVSGNSASSSTTKSIKNPFIRTEAQADSAAKMILSACGGNQYEIIGRGDPSSEIGDVDTVWLNESSAFTGRRIYQAFSFNNGVMQNCKSTLLKADGALLYQDRAIITKDCTWEVPDSVSTLRVVLVGGGQGSTSGQAGTFDTYGEDGVDGSGGNVWRGTIDVNSQQTFVVTIGAGGDSEGGMGGDTTFGVYSSANGKVYENGYADITSGNSYGRTGVKVPLQNSGDGARHGSGGSVGVKHVSGYDADGGEIWTVDVKPGTGGTGSPGASGCVVVYWDLGGVV
jgi:hypothetical protein